MGSPAELKPLVPAIGRGWCACSPTAKGIGCVCQPEKALGQKRAVDDGLVAAMVGTAAAAVVAAAAAPVGKTSTARMMTLLPAGTTFQAG